MKPPSDSTGKWLGFLIAGLCIALAFIAFNCQSAVITDSFLDRVAVVESGGKNVVGDDGRSVGVFQMGLAAWLECNEARQSAGLKTYPFSYATNATISRAYCRQFLLIQSNRLFRAMGRVPTQAETYSAYNQGFHAFKRRGFLLKNNPSTTKQGIKRLNK